MNEMMMEAEIEIETFDKNLVVDLFEAKKFVAGKTEKSISNRIFLRYEGRVITEAVRSIDRSIADIDVQWVYAPS